MEYAIEILEIDLHKWKELRNQADMKMIEPDTFFATFSKEAEQHIRDLEKAISILKAK